MAGTWHPNFLNSKNEDNPTKNEDNLTQKNDPTQKIIPTQPKKLKRSLPKIKTTPPMKWRRPATISEDELSQTPSEHIDFCNGAVGLCGGPQFTLVYF